MKLTKFKKNLLTCAFLGVTFFNVSKVDSALRTHQLNYVREAGTGDQALTGTIIIDDSSVTFGSFQSPIPAWVDTLNMTYTDASGNAQNFTKSDFNAINFVKKVGVTVDYSAGRDLVSQFQDIRFYSGGVAPSGGSSTFRMGIDLAEFNLVSTPGPFPFFAFLPFIYFINKIKKSIKSE